MCGIGALTKNMSDIKCVCSNILFYYPCLVMYNNIVLQVHDCRSHLIEVFNGYSLVVSNVSLKHQ